MRKFTVIFACILFVALAIVISSVEPTNAKITVIMITVEDGGCDSGLRTVNNYYRDGEFWYSETHCLLEA
jgi:hypothetical protein